MKRFHRPYLHSQQSGFDLSRANPSVLAPQTSADTQAATFFFSWRQYKNRRGTILIEGKPDILIEGPKLWVLTHSGSSYTFLILPTLPPSLLHLLVSMSWLILSQQTALLLHLTQPSEILSKLTSKPIQQALPLWEDPKTQKWMPVFFFFIPSHTPSELTSLIVKSRARLSAHYSLTKCEAERNVSGVLGH